MNMVWCMTGPWVSAYDAQQSHSLAPSRMHPTASTGQKGCAQHNSPAPSSPSAFLTSHPAQKAAPAICVVGRTPEKAKLHTESASKRGSLQVLVCINMVGDVYVNLTTGTKGCHSCIRMHSDSPATGKVAASMAAADYQQTISCAV